MIGDDAAWVRLWVVGAVVGCGGLWVVAGVIMIRS